MRSKKNKLIIPISLFLIIIILVSFMVFRIFSNDIKINRILKTESYSYLPLAAQNYVKEAYEKTNEIVLTEKNKQVNAPYLNPKYIEYLSLSEEEKKEIESIPETYVIDYAPSLDDVGADDLPSYFNLSNVNGMNFLSPMYNQGSLGLCWAFASIEQAESYLMIQKNESYDDDYSETFSVRQMDYAISENGIENYDNPTDFRSLTDGGNYAEASLIMSYGLSLTDNNEWPYDYNKNKKPLVDVLNFANSKYELNSSTIVPNIGSGLSSIVQSVYRKEIKRNIKSYGGAYVGTVSPDSACGFKNIDGTYAMVDTGDCGGDSGHAMHIIGWDDNYSYKYCESDKKHYSVNSSGACDIGSLKTGTGAWIIKNSWGENTKYKYVYLSYNSSGIDVGITTSLTPMSARTWDNNYYKSIFTDNQAFLVRSQDITYTKPINTKEKVEKVKFFSMYVEGNFTVSIITESQTYEDIKKVNVDYPGIYTIDLSDQNIILNGEQFTVRLSSPLGQFYQDSISVFTSNVDDKVYIKTNNLTEDKAIINKDKNLEYIVYSETKNIDSNKEITYSLFKNKIDYSKYILNVKNNKVARNNVNATLVIDKVVGPGNYTLKTSYNGTTTESTITIPEHYHLEGSGTETNPYIIYNEDDLNQIKYRVNSHFLLKNDITLTNEWEPIGTFEEPFTGGFDGGGHTISGLKINGTTDDPVGFFGYLIPNKINDDENTYIRNLTFEEPLISNVGNAAVLIGNIYYNVIEFIEPATGAEYIYDNLSIDNVHFIGGNVSAEGDAGVIAAFVYIGNFSVYNSLLSINNVYSSTNLSGYYSAGLIGYFEDYYISTQNKMLKLKMSNFQNTGIINVDGHKYDNTKPYSPVIGSIYGNVDVTLNNYIINSTFSNTTYMKDFVSKKSQYYIGLLFGEDPSKTTFNISTGYYVTKYADGVNYISGEKLTNSNLYSSWKDFNKYWKIETVDGINRIPILKNINYDYTKTKTEEISLNVWNKVSLLDYTNINYPYISYEIISNDNIIEITDNLTDDINIEALKKGKAIIKLVNNYDGYTKNIEIISNGVSIITYYIDNTPSAETYIQKVNSLDLIPLTQNKFTKEGYKFIGWNTKVDGTGTSYKDNEEISVTENLTLYAQWEPLKYTIIFNSNTGIGEMPEQIYVHDVSQKINKNIYTREGYNFTEWNTEKDGSGTSYSDEQEISVIENITLYAQWEKLKYKVTFNINAGTDNKKEQEFVYGESKRLTPNIFTREGYNFIGWNTKPDGSGTSYNDSEEVSITGDIVLYAQWEQIKYIVIFDSNTGKGEMLQQEYLPEQIQKLKVNEFTKTGFNFIGWNTKSDGSGTSYEDGQETSLTEDITLYAQWEINKYTVGFNSNGGICEMSEQIYIYGEYKKLNSNGFEREGYKFIGWNTKPDGAGTSYKDNEEISVTENLTLYAQWEVLKYQIVFNPNGNFADITTQEYTYGEYKKLNSNGFEREGYKFIGWNTKTDGTGKSYKDGEEISIKNHLVLYAQWEVLKYKVTFNANGGTGNMSEQEFIYGEQQKINPNKFTKAGKVFIGWNTEADGSGTNYIDNEEINIKEDLILYAQWGTEIPYAIKKYEVDIENKYIDLIDVNTTLDEFLQNVKVISGYSILVDTKTIDNKKIIYTGGKTKIYKSGKLYIEFTNIVSGDASGDGKINYLDYVYVYNHIYKTKHPESDKKILENEYMKAGDFKRNNKIDYLDYVFIYNKIKSLKGGTE